MDERVEKLFHLLYPNYEILTDVEKENADKMRNFLLENLEELDSAASYAIEDALEYGIAIDDKTALLRAIYMVEIDKKRKITPKEAAKNALRDGNIEDIAKLNKAEEPQRLTNKEELDNR